MANALKKLGEAALKPVFRDGSWHKPRCSARIAADLKKEALAAGRQDPWTIFGSSRPIRGRERSV